MSRQRLQLSRRVARALRASWDRQQEYHIPEREVRFEVLLAVLARMLPPRSRILDLGCGTGSLSERVLRRFPRARVWALDYDPVLLRLGRAGVGDVGGRLTWVEADLRTPRWADALSPGRFDAAVSTTALHWLTARELRGLFRALASRLRPGAIFLNGDGIPFDRRPGRPEASRIPRLAGALDGARTPARPPSGTLSWSAWWRMVNSLPALRGEAAERRRRYPSSHEGVVAPSIGWHTRELYRAGFAEVAVVWQQGADRVVLAVR